MTSAGRPRDPRVDEALRRVVQELLVAVGYTGLTVQGVARGAGVSPATVYRRFPGKRELVEWAAFQVSEWVEPAWTGDYAEDLAILTELLLGYLAQPAVRAAVPGLLSEYVHEGSGYLALLAATITPVRRALGTLHEGALSRGEASEGIDLDALLEVLLGAVLLAAMTRTGSTRAAAVRIADVARRATC
jgi:AcrR family transcriptional regulator